MAAQEANIKPVWENSEILYVFSQESRQGCHKVLNYCGGFIFGVKAAHFPKNQKFHYNSPAEQPAEIMK